MNHQEVIKAIRKEWNRVYHNASLLYTPLFVRADEREGRAFEQCMRQRVEAGMLHMHATALKRFRLRLSFRQYGRQGATIAPHEWAHRSDDHPWSLRFKWDDVVNRVDETEDCLAHNTRVLDCLRWINETVRAEVDGTQAWWEQEKVGLGLDFTEPDPFGNTMYVVVNRSVVRGGNHPVFSEDDEGSFAYKRLSGASLLLQDLAEREGHDRNSAVIYRLERVSDELVDEAMKGLEIRCCMCGDEISAATHEEHGMCYTCLGVA